MKRKNVWSRGGDGTPLYKPYRYVLPQRVGFLRRFGLKMGVLKGNTECMNVFVVSIPNE